MPLEYFDPEDSTADIVTVLMRDGAAVVRHEIGPEVVDAVRAELRSPFDKVGTCDESDFNGTRRYGSVACSVFPIHLLSWSPTRGLWQSRMPSCCPIVSITELAA